LSEESENILQFIHSSTVLVLLQHARAISNKEIAMQLQNSQYIIRLRQAILKTGLSRSTIYTLIKLGDFPKQIQLSPRTMGFLESEIDEWIAGRIAASRVA
jgi:prophage regulatory protein